MVIFRLFLQGVKKHGRGRWKDISREFVLTKTPTQIASHAQKYFVHHQTAKEMERKKKRRSIHDITLNNNDTLVTLPLEKQHEIPPQDTATLNNKDNDNLQQTQQMYQLALLYPIGSTLPDMNKLEKMRNLFNLLAKDL